MIMSWMDPFANQGKEATKKRRERKEARKGHRNTDSHFLTKIKLHQQGEIKKLITKCDDDDCNSETTAESSNYNSLSDSEISDPSTPRNVLKSELSNYFYRINTAPKNHGIASVTKVSKKKNRKEKNLNKEKTKKVVEEKEKVEEGEETVRENAFREVNLERQPTLTVRAMMGSYLEECSFMNAMNSMNIGCQTKGCEMGDDWKLFIPPPSMMNDNSGVRKVPRNFLLDDAISYNPPVITHVQC